MLIRKFSANNFLRGKVTSARGIGKYEDATGTLRDLPIDFEWTAEQGKQRESPVLITMNESCFSMTGKTISISKI